jgi:hypothetical protein
MVTSGVPLAALRIDACTFSMWAHEASWSELHQEPYREGASYGLAESVLSPTQLHVEFATETGGIMM